MALADNWYTFIGLNGGEAGARDMFEKVMEELLRVENPGKEVHLVRASQGDGGIDVYVHQENGIDVYQCKFFMGSMNSSRWTQVKDSFDRAIKFFKSDEARGVKMLRWCLCMPREMQKEDISKWDTFCEDRNSYGIDIANIDGNEIIQRMKKCDRLKDTDFISRYFTVPENVREGLKSIPKCLTDIPMVDQAVGLVGREKMLETILPMLEGEKRLALVSGLGGIGKTAVMQWVCNDLKVKGNYVAWIDCGSSLKDDLLSLSDAFGIHDDDPDTAFRMIISAIKTQLDGALYLFMDNLARHPDVDELRVLNSLNAHIMVTSRQKNSAFPSVDLDVLGPEEALTMFFRYYNGDTDRSYIGPARDIVTSVKRHTLLVELLAKAAARVGGTLEDFAKDLAEKGVFDVFKRKLAAAHEGNQNKTIEDCVMKLYEISGLSKEQQRIMKLFSIFTPEREIYWKVAEWAGLDPYAVDELVERAWLGRSGLENNYTIHQIIKDSLARQLKKSGEVLKIEEEYKDLLEEVINTNSYMPRHLEYTKVRERLTLAEDIADHLAERTAGLLTSGDVPEQEEGVLVRASTLYNNMACVFRAQGDYEKALEYYGKDLAISERVLGPEHPSTATTYNNMAGVYEDKGDYEKALEYYGKALAISERVLGTEHPDTAATYNNMAGVYYAQGDYEKALEYYGKALAIRERVLGTEHPSTATTYNNMAGVYKDRGDYEKALEYYGKALEIKERVLGPEHPSTATTYNNMAGVFRAQGDYEKALEYYGKALAIRERVLGTEHPDTAATYNNMALVYKAQGDYEKALEYYGKALEIKVRVLGTEHPSTATTYNNMAGVYSEQGEYEKALEYYEKALAVFKMKLGDAHPYTQDTQMSVQIMELLIDLGIDEEQLMELIKRKP